MIPPQVNPRGARHGEVGHEFDAPPSARSKPGHLRSFAIRARTLLSHRLGQQLAWIVAPFGTVQILRLATSIVLTRLLAPEIFGVMLLINSLRTGTELLSDIGIGQSVVRSAHGEDRAFLDAAWTLQVLRGTMLAAIALVAAYPIATLYERPELASLIMAISPVFILTGLQSPGYFLAQRRMQLHRFAIFDVSNAVFNAVVVIGLAAIMPTVWALIIGLVTSMAGSTVMSYVAFERYRPRLRWDARHAREIIAFGKWIFLSTAIYFSATTFDRFYFVGALPLAFAGIYGVARTFSDMLAALAQRAGSMLVFPRAAALQDRREEMAPHLRKIRRKTLALVAVVTGLAVAGSDQFILLAYDERYHAAAFIIPILMVSVWFGILSSFGESLLMGLGRPGPGALANGAKFLTLLIGLPLAIAQGSVLLALTVLIAAEAARWMALSPAAHRERVAKVRDDVLLTAIMAGTALAAKAAAGALGLAPTVGEWWALRVLIQG